MTGLRSNSYLASKPIIKLSCFDFQNSSGAIGTRAHKKEAQNIKQSQFHLIFVKAFLVSFMKIEIKDKMLIRTQYKNRDKRMFDERLEEKTLFEAILPSVPEKSNITIPPSSCSIT